MPQQSSSPSSPEPPAREVPAQSGSGHAAPAPTDGTAQIDELLKKASEQVGRARNKDAEEAAQQALELSRKAGDKTRIMKSLNALAYPYFLEVRLTEALGLVQEGVQLARQLQDKSSLASGLNLEASILRALGRFEEALGLFEESAGLARELKDLPMQWRVTRSIGILYNEMGDSERAEAPLKDALRMAEDLKGEQWKDQVKDRGKFAREASLETLGLWEAGREHYVASIRYLEEALADKPENPGLTVELLVNLAFCYDKLGEYQKGADLLKEAMKLWEAGNRPHPVIVFSLAATQEWLGQLPEALAGLQRAMTLVRESGGNAQYEWQIGGRLARVQREMGCAQEALAQYQETIHTIETLRASALKTESGRAFALSTRHDVYAETADLLFDLHRESEALEMAERGHARAFMDMLAMARSGVPDELTPEQLQREDSTLTRISDIEKQLWKENISPAEEKKIKAELAAAEDDLEVFRLEMRRANPRYASIHYPQPITVPEIQNRLLDDRTALIEYLLGEKRSLVWVVTKKKITTSVLPARKEIEGQVNAFRKQLSERTSALTAHESLQEIARLGTKLYSSIFQPIAPMVASSRSLIIVPDGGLDYLPFEALVNQSRHLASGEVRPSYLAEKFAVVYGPSASGLLAVQEMNRETVTPSKMLLAFGDPVTPSSGPTPAASTNPDSEHVSSTRELPVTEDYAERGFSLERLPYSRQEILTISRLFARPQRHVYLDEAARKETLKTEKLQDFHYIHFASHGFLDEMKPGRSGLLFSPTPDSKENTVLRVDEIMRLKMNADLVTLSACSTGLGKLMNGEGILGLTRAFFYAGARNVTVSLWNVNDSATATLMGSFYRNLNRGLPKSEALRQAKLELIHTSHSTWNHPYFWAAFVLQGDGR